MKKNIFKIATVAVVTAIAGLGVYQTQQIDSETSDLIIANIEALAGIEEPSTGYTAESHPCPYPSFKNAIVCVRGGNDLSCMNSDCW